MAQNQWFTVVRAAAVATVAFAGLAASAGVSRAEALPDSAAFAMGQFANELITELAPR